MTAETPPQTGSSSVLPAFRAILAAQFISIFGDFLALFGIISYHHLPPPRHAVQVTTINIAYILPLPWWGR